MNARPYSDWSDAELQAEIDRFAPYLRESARRHDEAQSEARLRRAESVSAELARQWPEFKLEFTRALAQADRRLKALEASRGSPDDILQAANAAIARLPEIYNRNRFEEGLIRAAPGQFREDLDCVGIPPASTLPLLLRNLVIALGLLSLSRDGHMDFILRIVRNTNWKFHRLNRRLTQIEAHLGEPQWSEPDGPGVGEDDGH